MRSSLPARSLVLVVALIFAALVFPGCSPRHESGGEAGQAVAGEAENPEKAKAAEKTAESAPRVREITLPEGTELVVRTSSSISTKTNQPGQNFTALLEHPIVDEDWVVARKGAVAEGVITECDPGGRVKGVAHLAVRLQSLSLTDGRIVDIQTSSIGRRARTTKKKDAQKIGIGAGIGAAIGAIAGGGKGAAIGAAVGGGAGTGLTLATYGESASIPSESKLTFRLTEPVTVVREE